MKTSYPSPSNHRTMSGVCIAAAVGIIVFGLVVVVALLVADPDRDSTSRRCPAAPVGTVDPVTCLPYVGSHSGTSGSTDNSRSSTARKPAAQQPKAPAAKAPAVKAPAPAAPKAPAPVVKAPPVRLTK